MSAHLQAISAQGGLFDDTTVTGSRWQGQQRRIRVVLYRRFEAQRQNPGSHRGGGGLNDGRQMDRCPGFCWDPCPAFGW